MDNHNSLLKCIGLMIVGISPLDRKKTVPHYFVIKLGVEPAFQGSL